MLGKLFVGASKRWTNARKRSDNVSGAAGTRQLEGVRIHRGEALEIYGVDRAFLAELSALLERRMVLELTVSDRQIYLTFGDATLTGAIERFALLAS